MVKINLVRLAGLVTMVVTGGAGAGEVAGVEDARVSRARVRRGRSTTILNSFFVPFGAFFSEGVFFKVSLTTG